MTEYADLAGEVIPRHEPSTWLLERLGIIREGRTAPDAIACRHLEDLGKEPISAAWVEGLYLCLSCAGGIRALRAVGPCCDRCGEGGTLYPLACMADRPGGIVLFGLCAACYRLEVPDATVASGSRGDGA